MMTAFCMFSCVITQFGPIKVLDDNFFWHAERKHPVCGKKEWLFPWCGRHHNFNVAFLVEFAHSAPTMEGWSWNSFRFKLFQNSFAAWSCSCILKMLGARFLSNFFCRVSGLVFYPSAKQMQDILKCDWQQKRVRKKNCFFRRISVGKSIFFHWLHSVLHF